MMNIYSHKKIQGVSLVDALIAMAVGAVGLMALAVFNADLLLTSGESRTRAEAVHLAQQKMEQLRDLAVENDFLKTTNGVYVAGDKLFDQSVAATGVNSTFTVASVITGHAAGTTAASSDTKYLTAKVTVSWANSENSQENVFVASLIAWDDPTASAARGDIAYIGDLITVGAVAAPSGGGRLAELNETLFGGAQSDNNDGTWVYADGNGNYQIVADQLGDNLSLTPVFVSSEPLLQISGNIFTDGDAAELTILRVLTSDFGFCIYNEDGTTFSGSNGNEYVVNDVANSDIPNSGDFNCYIAASWHGNLGVLNKTGEDFCSASHRYEDNCEILDSNLYVAASLPISACTIGNPGYGDPVNGLIGAMSGQNFSINNGGCAAPDVAQPAVSGDVSISGNPKVSSIEFSNDGGVTFSLCTWTLQGQTVETYKCVTTEASDNTIRFNLDNGSSCAFDVRVELAEVVRDVINASCDAP